MLLKFGWWFSTDVSSLSNHASFNSALGQKSGRKAGFSKLTHLRDNSSPGEPGVSLTCIKSIGRIFWKALSNAWNIHKSIFFTLLVCFFKPVLLVEETTVPRQNTYLQNLPHKISSIEYILPRVEIKFITLVVIGRSYSNHDDPQQHLNTALYHTAALQLNLTYNFKRV